MSVINQMHQDFRQVQENAPFLGKGPEKKSPKKGIILVFICLLFGSSLGLALVIFNQQRNTSKTANTQATASNVLVQEKPAITQPIQVSPLDNDVQPPKEILTKVVPNKKVVSSKLDSQQPVALLTAQTLVASERHSSGLASNKNPQENINVALAKKEQSIVQQPVEQPVQVQEKRAQKIPRSAPAVQQPALISSENKSTPILQIKSVQLSEAERAQLTLKEAQNAEDKGELQLAAEKRQQALMFQPTLNEVRKSLALYYYGQGNIDKATTLLHNGAVVSPDYSDFNLMLSRIALKQGDFQKAYLYLEQHPPTINGHLDYYVSHAILAQKFHKYEQSERLYLSLLGERPNNGRWRMALAIAQDKQSKINLALSNYKNALLQPDLSSKAKDYVEQRISYLEKEL